MARKAAALAPDADLREHLIAAAAQLIAARGFAGLTVRDIAAQAKVGTGVLYNHFADKEELLALGLHAHVRASEQALGDPPGPAGAGTVRANLIAYLERAISLHRAITPAFAGLITQPGVLNRFRQLPNPMAGGAGLREEIAAYLRAERRLGRIARRADVDTAATVIVGACHELVLPSLYGGHDVEPAETFAADVIKTVLNGIAPAH